MNDDPYAPSKVALPSAPDVATRGERAALSLVLWANALSSGFFLLLAAAAGVSLALDSPKESITTYAVMLAAIMAAALSLWGSAALSMRRSHTILLLLPMIAALGCVLAIAPDWTKFGWLCLHLWFVAYSIVLWRRGRLR